MNQELKQEYKQTELGELPIDWDITTIKEIGTVVTGRTPSTNVKEYYGNKYMFIAPADLDNGKYVKQSKKWLSKEGLNVSRSLPQNTILVGCIGTIGKTAMTSEDNCTTNQQINAIIPNSKINPDYLYYTMVYFGPNLSSLSGKVTIPIINKSNFEIFKIPLPPLPEQQKISYVLSTIQDDKEKTENIINSYKELKKSLMKHLFKYGSVKFEDADKVKLKETEIGEMPEGWDVVKLGDTVKTYSGGTPHREKEEYYNGNIGWLKSGELNDKRVYASDEYITTDGLNNSSAKYVEDGTLLLALYGATAGKVGLAKAKLTINQAICAIVPNEKFFSEFYFYYLMTIRDKLLAERFGGAQPNLNQQIIKNLLIPLPSLPIQQEIAEILSSVDSKIEQEENKKNSLEELFKSMLYNLMAAKIRVKDINND